MLYYIIYGNFRGSGSTFVAFGDSVWGAYNYRAGLYSSALHGRKCRTRNPQLLRPCTVLSDWRLDSVSTWTEKNFWRKCQAKSCRKQMNYITANVRLKRIAYKQFGEFPTNRKNDFFKISRWKVWKYRVETLRLDLDSPVLSRSICKCTMLSKRLPRYSLIHSPTNSEWTCMRVPKGWFQGLAMGARGPGQVCIARGPTTRQSHIGYAKNRGHFFEVCKTSSGLDEILVSREKC